MTEREWREASDMGSSPVNLGIVLAVAAVLRFWSLGHGIPFMVGSDEPVIMEKVVAMMKSGDFNPHFFDYGGLIFYLHLPVAVARFLVGAVAGHWSALDQVGPDDFFLWARAVSALLGTATVFLLYLVGLRWGTRHALLGAGLLAVMPMHVRESHYALTDVPATFFVTLTLLLTLVAHEKATARAFFWAGIAVGLATATKYNAGLALALPVVAVWMTTQATPSRLRCLLAMLMGALVAFLVASPYTVLDLPGFLNGFAALSMSYRPRSPWSEPGWLVYLKHLKMTLGWPASVLLVAGYILGIVRAIKGPSRVGWTLLVTLPALYFAAIANRSLIFGRYLLPLLPFACLLASLAVVSGVSLLRRFDIPRTPRRLLIVGLTVAALLPPLVVAIAFDRRISKESTQEVVYKWVLANVPAGAHLAVERTELRLPGARFRAESAALLIDCTAGEYVRDGVEYLVASSNAYGSILEAPQLNATTYGAYRRLFDESQQLFVVKPDARHPGPEIRIYKVARSNGSAVQP